MVRLALRFLAGIALLVAANLSYAQQADFPKINFYYLIPSDRDFNQAYLDGIEKAVLTVQSFYSEQLGGSVFATTNPIVQVVHSTRNTSWHADRMWFRAIDTIGAKFNDPNNIHVIFIDAMQSCPEDSAVGGTSGIAVLPENDLRGLAGQQTLPNCKGKFDNRGEKRWIGGLAHELGHALTLPHPPGCDDVPRGVECDLKSIMSLGYEDYTTAHFSLVDKATLMNSGFFSPYYKNPRGFPIEESFENDITWYDVGKFKWIVQSNHSSTAYTGPSQAAHGYSYLFFETSYGFAYQAGDEAVLESDVFAAQDAKISFQYHMYGADIGTLSIDVSSDGLNWETIWSKSGQQQYSITAAWSSQVVRLDNYSGNIRLRIRATAAGGDLGDIAIDNLKIHNGIEILNSWFDGTWFFTEWTPVSYASNYSQFVIGDFSNGRRWLNVFNSGAVWSGHDSLYQYYHRGDICKEFGQGTYKLSAQVWPELLGNLSDSSDIVGNITCN